MDNRARELIGIGDALFSDRMSMMSYWQETAEHFYPIRADFTRQRSLGVAPFDTGLMTSTPVLASRELGNMISTLLRPRSTPWFACHVADERIDKAHMPRMWLEYASRVMRRAMYDPLAMFVRATKEADHDWTNFGQAVISIEINMAGPSLLYRDWHLRDCAWSDDQTGVTNAMHRKWHPTARNVCMQFPKTVDPKLQAICDKEPNKKVNCRHIVVPRDMYAESAKKSPGSTFTSLYIDVENEAILEERPVGWFPYIVPRWQTLSGTQYGWSPATGPSLAEARTLQAVMRVLLEAGEKAVDPPMIATMEAVRSDLNLMAGGTTWVDIEYDERNGEALRPITQNMNIPLGIEIADKLTKTLGDGMFINKVSLPGDMDLSKMTAYALRKRIEENIRSTAPLFEPAEDDYNAKLCDTSFQALMKMKTFGPVQDMPRDLLGSDIHFKFTSPLSDMADEGNYQKFLQAGPAIQLAASIDPAQIANLNVTSGFRAAVKGAGWSEEWLNEPDAVEQQRAVLAEQSRAQQGMAALGSGAVAAKDGAIAASKLMDAGVLGPSPAGAG